MASRTTTYQPLDLNPKVDRENSRPLYNAELLLRDVYAMLFLPRKDIGSSPGELQLRDARHTVLRAGWTFPDRLSA